MGVQDVGGVVTSAEPREQVTLPTEELRMSPEPEEEPETTPGLHDPVDRASIPPVTTVEPSYC